MVYNATHELEPGTSTTFYMPSQYSGLYKTWTSYGDTSVVNFQYSFTQDVMGYTISIPSGATAGTTYHAYAQTDIDGSWSTFLDVSVTVTVPTFSIRFRSNGTYGSVSNAGGSYTRGTSVSCTATPAADCAFEGWYKGGEFYSTANTITLYASEDTEAGYTANFYKVWNNVYFESADSTAGSVSTPGGQYLNGSNAECTAIPNDGYLFSSWKWKRVGSSTEYAVKSSEYELAGNTLRVIASDTNDNKIFKAYFTKIARYTVNISAGTGGTVSPTQITDVLTGTEINYGRPVTTDNNITIGSTTVNAYPDRSEGSHPYHVKSWSGIPSSMMVTSNLDISVSFGKDLKVTYLMNGGTGAVDPDYVWPSGATVRLPNLDERIQSRSGYTFWGWMKGSSTASTYYRPDTDVEITSDTSFYAKWAPKTYTVTFNANGGTVSQTSKTVTYNSSYGDLPTPTYPGHKFKGWVYNGASVSSSTKYQIAGDSTLLAMWDSNTYTIAYNKNNSLASGTMSNQTMTYGASATLRKCTFTGRTYDQYQMKFRGWSLSSTATVPTYSDEEDVTDLATSGTVTLYAVWGNWATLSLACSPPNGGTASIYIETTNGDWIESHPLDNNEIYATKTIRALANAGFALSDQWTGTPDGAIKEISPDLISGVYHVKYLRNATLTANFLNSTHTITLQKSPSNKGSVSVDVGNPVPNHADVTFTATSDEADYPFLYWEFTYLLDNGATYTKTIYQAIYTFSDVTSDMTATAYFGGQYTVTLDKTRGSGGADSVTAIYGHPMPTLTSSQLPTMASTFSFGGYYDGWQWEYPSGGRVTGTKYYNADGTSARNWDKMSNATLYADWVSYMVITVTADPASAGTVTGDGQKEVGSAFEIKATANSGYAFDRWTWDSMAASSTKNPKTFDESAVVTSTEFIAHFVGVQYRVRFNPNGGNGTATYQQFRYGTAQNLTTIAALGFTNGSYTFFKWNTKADGTGVYYSDGASVSDLTAVQDGIVDLYAIWQGDTYLLSFSPNPSAYGTVTETVGETTTSNPQFSVASGTTLTVSDNTITVGGHTVIATPSEGCSFANWSGYSTTVLAAQTIYANFEGTPRSIVVRLVKGRQYLSQTVLDNEGNVLEAQLETSPNTWNGMTFYNPENPEQ